MKRSSGVRSKIRGTPPPPLLDTGSNMEANFQKSIKSVFIQVLKTARGEEIVKNHEKGGVFRAQEVYRDLVAYKDRVLP